MASSKAYLHFILEQLSDLDDVSYRPMMEEFILYYRGRIIGGIYDNRLLVKKTKAALELMPAAICELPYPNSTYCRRHRRRAAGKRNPKNCPAGDEIHHDARFLQIAARCMRN